MLKKILKKKQELENRFDIRLNHIFELVVFSFLLTLLIAPGLFYTDVMAHEFYHYAQHKGISEEICIDINKPYLGHVKIAFEDKEELLEYEQEELGREEKRAEIFGHFASALYLVNALIVVNWMLKLTISKQKRRK